MKKIFSNNIGFTLVELMVAVGISAVVVIPMTMLMDSTSQKAKTQIEKTSIGITDVIMAQNMIVGDLADAEPSFNFLNVMAEVGDAKDAPSDCVTFPRKNFWEKTYKNSCLPWVISLDSDGDEFVLLKKVTNPTRTAIHFTPDRFFDLSGNVAGGTLSFSSGRFVNQLMKPDPQTKKSACLGKDFLKVSSLGDFFVMEGGVLKPLQYALILPCAETSSDLEPLTSSLVLPFSKDGCRDKSLYTGVRRLETFFRCMPLAGGLANAVAEPVEFIRYRIIKNKTNSKIVTLKLVREKGTIPEGSSSFVPESSVTLIEDFGSLKFYRNITTQSLIKFKISKKQNI